MLTRRAQNTLAGLFCLPLLARAHVFSLSDLAWTLRNQNGSIVIPGSLPSQAHIDLFKAGVIGDPLVGINEYTERWVVNDNWTYTADLAPFAQYNDNGGSEKTLLVFYGIDTIANITFAGHPVAWVNNQFRRYIFDVSGYLTSPVGDDNNLTVSLESAWYYGLNCSATAGEDIAFIDTIDNYEYPNVRQYIRKIEDDFGWDMTPAFVPSGIYKPAYLVTLSESDTSDLPDDPTYPHVGSTILVDETSVDIYKYGQDMSLVDPSADWVVNVTLGVRSVKSYAAATVTLSIPELGISSQALPFGAIPNNTQTATFASVNWSIQEGVPERWFPWNLGTPKLYNLTVTLDPSGGAGLSSEIITQTITTGFRTIQLMQLAYPEEDVSQGITPGDQWHFEINGEAFYSKGSNVVPFDPFYARTNPDAVRWVLDSAVKTGQNMVRVWGSGTYQPSDAATDGGLYDFYSTCDELGLLVWSDLNFGDALYPTDDAYLANLEPELRENIRRVNKHPSNVQWSGGNGNELLITGVLEAKLNNSQDYLNNYLFYFQDFLHDLVLSETHSVAYTDSCTTNGVLSLNPYELRLLNETAGDIYGNAGLFFYDAPQAFNLTLYPVSRFVNEFGMHSMSSFYTWLDVLESPEDFSFNSTAVMSRDRHPPATNLTWPNPNAPEGQYQMTSAVEFWLPTPGTADTNQTFAQWCWSTQVFQSMLLTAEIAWYRRGAGMGENNLGSLVWHLNDIWQGITWSTMEYSGRWKVANYGVASAYTSVTIQPFWMPENETLTVLVTSDQLETVSGTAQLTWYDWTGHALSTSTESFSAPALNNSLVYEETGLAHILPAGYNASDVWLLLNVTADLTGGETVTHESYFTPVSLAQANLVDPKIAVNVGDGYTFTLSAQGGVGVWTWLDHPHGTVGYFIDTTTGYPSNGFYLVPGIDRTVQFVSNAALSTVANPDPSDFVLRTVWNNTHL